jgi:hypothetical protein
MKTITELWNELQNHPDYVTGSLWTKQSIVNLLEDHVDDEDFNRISELFVDENKKDIAFKIRQFEDDNYEYGSWHHEIEDLIEEGSKKIFAYDSEIA